MKNLLMLMIAGMFMLVTSCDKEENEVAGAKCLLTKLTKISQKTAEKNLIIMRVGGAHRSSLST